MFNFLGVPARLIFTGKSVASSARTKRLQWKRHYSRFQVTFQSAFPKFVLIIPNYITKFGILRENLNVQSEICMLVN